MTLTAFTSISTATQPPHLAPERNQTKPIRPIPNQIKPNKPVDSTVSWTSSIARLCRYGQLTNAASLFAQMRLLGVEANHITIVTLLSGCSDFPEDGGILGPQVHAYSRKMGLDTTNVMVGTAVVDMYAKCGWVELARLGFDEIKVKNSVSWNTMIDGYMRNGEIGEAINLFDEMLERDAISWTVLIDGFVKKGCFEEALGWFREMQVCKVEPDYVTVIAVLAACANLSTLSLGLWMHRYVLKKQEIRNNVRVCNSLIDMYSRCGCVELAHQVFKQMGKRTLVSWNSMIGGFASNGFTKEALGYFEMLQKEGLKPDGVSFTGALTACSHAGFVDEGIRYFDVMKRVYRITPRIEHYGCLVDLYSRAGRLEDALRVIEFMNVRPNEVIFSSLLAACRDSSDIDLAERLFLSFSDSNPSVDSNYVILGNMYAAIGKWDVASKVRRRMKASGIEKNPGFSSIEVGGSIHEFVASDKSHLEMESIHHMLQLLYLELRLFENDLADIERNGYENYQNDESL